MDGDAAINVVTHDASSHIKNSIFSRFIMPTGISEFTPNNSQANENRLFTVITFAWNAKCANADEKKNEQCTQLLCFVGTQIINRLSWTPL